MFENSKNTFSYRTLPVAASENKVDNAKKNRSKLSNIQSGYLSEVFKNKNLVLSPKQPENLLCLLTKARFKN